MRMGDKENAHFRQSSRTFSLLILKIPPRIAGKTRPAALRDHVRPEIGREVKSNDRQNMHGAGTLMLGVPCEKPVPTGCSTNRMLERLVQLNAFCVGIAWPQLQLKG